MSNKQYGILTDFVDDGTLEEWKKIYQKTSITKTTDGDPCWGIDKKCLAYNWFLKKVFPVLTRTFDKEIKLIFSSFIDLSKPFPKHTDLKPIPDNGTGKHYVSILIPYGINNKKDYFEKASTRFYANNETLVDVIQWKKNCMIWWNSEIIHDSGSFSGHGILSKQYFITHTYV